MQHRLGVFVAALAATVAAVAGQPARAQTELTMWSHWAAENPKRDYVEDAIRRFEAANPAVKIKASWYEKTALYAAVKTALRAGQAPDIFYAEPDQVEYMDNGFLLDLSDLNWAAIEPWAKEAWSYKGKPYGLPLEASTVELYYNKKLVDELGVTVPGSLQLAPDVFLDLVKKAKAKGHVPMSLGVGDRPFPGAYLVHEALLKRLGTDEYDKLLKGKLAWSDARVVETLRWVRSAVDAGLLPASFTSLKLGEAHSYFHTNPGAVLFLNGSWYTSRAFNPPRQGRSAEGLPARHHEVPGRAERLVPRMPDAQRPGFLRGQRGHEAQTRGGRLPDLVRDSGRGQPLARERARANRDQVRPFQDHWAACRLLQGPSRSERRRYVLFRRAKSDHAGQGQGGVHSGDEQCLPSRDDHG